MQMKKTLPKLNFWQIWNISFGFLGIQVGYSLQSGQTSRILSALGADPENLSLFWLAAPIAGLIVQPIVGMSSDHAWTKFGRRIPFILGGALVSAAAMFFMPNSEIAARIMPAVLFGACMLLFMDCAFNVSMQPFRALVGDMVSDGQRNLGYSLQSWLINIGAVIGSFLPIFLTWCGIKNIPAQGQKVAPSVIWSFYIGGAILLLTVLWTSFKVKEYPPKEFNEYHNIDEKNQSKQSFLSIIKTTPKTMLQLGVVQFFSWFALFIMWVYTTQAIAENVWHTTDAHSPAYNAAGNWTGVLQGVYGIFAILFSSVMPKIADKIGRKPTYSFALFVGAVGLVSMFFIKDKYALFVSMLGIGIAWAGILAMPYTILSAALPPSKMGVYMGLFNATITIPQIAAGVFGKPIYQSFAQSNSAVMLVVAGISMLLGAFAVFLVRSKKAES
jgi:maltose/moltooligosaccharide transporter